MLTPKDFFELQDYAHQELFADTEYVWEALKRLKDYIKATLKPGIYGTVEPGAMVEDDVYIGKGTVVEAGAMVKGPTIIGENCEVRQACYVRGNVVTGNDCVIGHCSELKGVIMLNEAQAPHFNYVGDSILGNDINLGASTICSNLKLTEEQVVVRINGEEYPTGLRKLGGIVGDRVQTGCNSVLNPGTLLGPGCLVYPCASIKGYFPPNSIIKLRQTVQVVERALTR